MFWLTFIIGYAPFSETIDIHAFHRKYLLLKSHAIKYDFRLNCSHISITNDYALEKFSYVFNL